LVEIAEPYYQDHGLSQSIFLKRTRESDLTRFCQSYGFLAIL